jgi:NAD(P)-dependent dehydrogenase (short-subunit alcohol dehydrogenase family)
MADPLTKVAAKLIDALVNPRRPSDLDELTRAVKGKVVLVTGASFGIGAATARLLGRAGATVLLAARTAERLEAVAADITAAGGRAYVYPADLADPIAAEALAGTIIAEHGHVDVLVSNAGKSIRRAVDQQYDRFHDFERTTAINYLGPVRLLLALLPSMRERGEGLIVNVSTMGVKMPPSPRWGAYSASKTAFDVWLRSIAPEIAPDGVDVSTIYMTLVHTRMSAPTPVLRQMPGMRSHEAAWLIARAILQRERAIGPWWLTPAELAGVALGGPLNWVLGQAFRLSTESSAAQDDAQRALQNGAGSRR